MLNSMFFLQFHGFSGGGFRNVLMELEQLGFFDYVLPFLIIFALVFGILTKMNLFGDQNNKTINAIIALAVGLMALQFGFVSAFFSELFPRLGIGLAIILSILVVVGMFMDYDEGWGRWMMFGIGAVIVIVVLAQTAEAGSWWYSGWWWSDNIGTILVLAAFVAIIGIIVGASGKDDDDKKIYLKTK